jgi:hypothetical protein
MGSVFFDGCTGENCLGQNPVRSIGRGIATDINPIYPAVELWLGARRVDTEEIIYKETPKCY